MDRDSKLLAYLKTAKNLPLAILASLKTVERDVLKKTEEITGVLMAQTALEKADTIDALSKLKNETETFSQNTSSEITRLDVRVDSTDASLKEVEKDFNEKIATVQTIKGDTGEKGELGEKGERGEAGFDGKDGKDGVDGKDGRDGKEGKRGPKGDKGDKGTDGKNGKDGLDGKDGSPDSGSEIVQKINGLGQSPKIDASHIKGLSQVVQGFSIKRGSGSSYTLPTASAETLGGVKIGARLTMTGDTLSADVQVGGTGDVVGPASAVDSNFAAFDTTTGKLIKDSGKSNASYAPALGADDNYVTDAEKVVIGNTSGTNTGDNAVNSNYSGLVTNATHTGDATGSGALSVVRIQGIAVPAPTAGDDAKVIQYDHGTTAFVYATAGGGSGLTQPQIMARLSVGF